jgi:uncharacterized membrane protein HdeD (DUF308 family)
VRSVSEESSTFERLCRALIERGTVALLAGVVAGAWPGMKIAPLVVLFSIYAFIDAAIEGIRVARGERQRRRVAHLVLAAIDVAAGGVLLLWPGPTPSVFLVTVAAWALCGGILELTAALDRTGPPRARRILTIGGATSLALGVLLLSRADVQVIGVAPLYAFFSVILGSAQVIMGMHGRLQLARADAVP